MGHYEIDGHKFDKRTDAMAYADNWGFHYSAIQWIDPNAPWMDGPAFPPRAG